MAKRRTALADIDAAISRWETRLFRTVTALQKLRKQRKRITNPALMKASDEHRAKYPLGHVHEIKVQGVTVPVPDAQVDDPLPSEPTDDLAIPGFLSRNLPGHGRYHTQADLDAEAKLKAEIEEKKKLKAKGRIAKLKAKQSGETKKMPLSGKAALAYINQG